MVTTFELVDAEIHPVGQHDSMSAASAQLPPGSYTTFRTYHHDRVLRLSQHLRRLEESVELMRKAVHTISDAAVRSTLLHAIRTTQYAESRFRLTFAPPSLFVSVEPFTPYPQSLYEEGVWCVIVSLHRDNPHAKSTTFISSAADAYTALPKGAHEGLMLGDDGAVLEGLSSNFFAVMPSPEGEGWGGVLHTEEARVLIGVTRSLVLEVARDVIPISTEAVKYDELPRVRECFITSVSREILPVVKIDDIVIGDGEPGPITRELMRRFRELITREALPIA
jgi:branched-subunit amino acid aminotransferase/4-amino-4-deoxychorismate lyase